MSACVAGRDRDRVRLLRSSASAAASSPPNTCTPDAVDECDGEQGERAGIPGQLHRARGERVERVVVPQLEHRHRLDDRRQQEPAHDLRVTVERLVADRLEREPERRHTRAGALRAPARQAVENEVDRSRRLRRRRRGSGRLGHLQHTGVGVEASGVHRRSEGLEVGLTRQRGIERFEPSGGIDKERRSRRCRDRRRTRSARAAAAAARAEARRAGVSSAVASSSSRGLAAPRLQLGLRGGESTRSSSCRVRGQLGRSLEERGRGRDAAPALGAVGRALEFVGDRLVETGRRVRAMPCAAIRIGLGIRRLGQRAVHLLALVHGCRPVHRRAHQRMAEAHPGAERDQLCRLGRRGARRLRSRVARPRATTA